MHVDAWLGGRNSGIIKPFKRGGQCIILSPLQKGLDCLDQRLAEGVSKHKKTTFADAERRSVKVVAGARNHREFLLSCPI